MRSTLLLALAAVVAMPLSAARLTYVSNGAPVSLAWPASAFPIPYAVDARIASAVPAGLVDRAFTEWTNVPETHIAFRPLGARNGLQPGKDGVNSVTMVDGLFARSGFIASTVWWDNAGVTTEADIQIDPTKVGANTNVQLLVEHEVGHFLGLDHSAVMSSVMYPFVGKGGPQTLDSDDRVSISSVYPVAPLSGATLQGRVTGNDGGVFAAQVVAMNSLGQPVAAALTNAQGDYTLEGIPAGDYRIYAEPLDGPVNVQNLTGIYRTASVVSFPTVFQSSGTLHAEDGRVYGNLDVNVSGAPVQLNPMWIGISPAGSLDMTLSCEVATVHAGDDVTIAVGGDGFTSGMTTFEVLNPKVRRTSDYRYAGNYVAATFLVPPDVTPGSAVILVHSGNVTAALTGALRVEALGKMRVARK